MDLHRALIATSLAAMLNTGCLAQTTFEPTEAVAKLLNDAYAASEADRPAAFDSVTAKAHALGDREGEAFALEFAGLAYGKLKAWDKAVDRLSASDAIFQQTGDRQDESNLLTKLGDAYASFGKGPKAVETYERSVALHHAFKDDSGEGAALAGLGNVLIDLGRLAEAQAAYETALPLAQRDGDRRGEAIIYHNLGEVFSNRSEAATALSYYEKALPVLRELKDQSSEANTLRSMAGAHEILGDNKQAFSELASALEIWTRLDDLSGTARGRSMLGRLYMKTGEPAKAREQLGSSLAAFRKEGIRDGEAGVLLDFGVLEDDLGDKAKALEDDEKALAILNELGEPRGIAKALLGFGTVEDSLGQRAKALDAYQRAYKLLHDLGDREGQAAALGDIGSTYIALFETEKALKCLNEALKIDLNLGAIGAEASDYNALAVYYDTVGQPREALENAQKALALWQQVGDRRKSGLAYNTIGNAHLNLGQIALAKENFDLALTIAAETGDASSEAVLLNNLAFCQEKTGNPTGALQTYSRAVAMERKLGDVDQEAATYSNLLLFFETQQAPGLAALNGKLSVNLYQSLRSGAAGTGASAEQSYREKVTPTYRELAGVLARMGRLAEAEQVIGLLKDSEYSKFLETRAATGPQNVNLTALESSWAQKYDGVFKEVAGLSAEYDALSRIGASVRTPTQRARLKEIDVRFEACNTALAAYFTGAREAFSKANAAASRLDDLEAATGLTTVLKALPGHPAAIYTFVTQDGIHLLLNLPNGSVYREPAKNLPAADLNERILAFRQALQDPLIDPRPIGAELYELIVRPIEKDLEDGKVDSLMWSLDSRLRYVPLWALYDAKAGKFLIEKYPSSLFTPRTVERQVRDVHPGAWQGVEFGVSLGRTVGSLQFGALPGVPNELKAVSEQVGGEPKIDKGFTRDAFDDALSSKPKIVHIATHFNFVPGDEKDSFMLFGTSELSIEEFKRMRNGSLDGVELLVLSACDTANGDMRASAADGGEFESFALLAQLKGADSVLASLWPVNDASTSLLMGEFYRLRKAHPEWTKLESLRQAQIEMLQGKVSGESTNPGRSTMVRENPLLKDLPHWAGKGFSHPFYWAPFELIGNWK